MWRRTPSSVPPGRSPAEPPNRRNQETLRKNATRQHQCTREWKGFPSALRETILTAEAAENCRRVRREKQRLATREQHDRPHERNVIKAPSRSQTRIQNYASMDALYLKRLTRTPCPRLTTKCTQRRPRHGPDSITYFIPARSRSSEPPTAREPWGAACSAI